MKNNKSLAIGLLCIALVFIGIGYSIFNSTLNISGTAKSAGNFDVKITNVQVDNNNTSNGAKNTMADVGDNYAVTETTLSAKFNAPGDYITYDITVTNRGSIDALISVTSSPQVDDDSSFSMSCNAVNGTELSANGGNTTFQCIMTFDGEHNLESIENVTVGNLQVTVNAVQKGSTTIEPAVLCYTPLDEEKTLGVINGNAKTAVSTYGAENIQVGDLLGFGTSEIDSNEQFYVIEKTGNKLKLLSRYDINLGPHQKPWDNCSRDTTGLQDKTLSFTRSDVNMSPTEEELRALEARLNEGTLYGGMQFYNKDSNNVSGYWWDDVNDAFDTTNYPLGTSNTPFVSL